MQIDQMHRAIKIAINRVNGRVHRDYLAEEIDEVINTYTIPKLINDAFKPDQKQTSFQLDQSITGWTKFSTLISEELINPVKQGQTSDYLVSFPDALYKYLYLEVPIRDLKCNSVNVLRDMPLEKDTYSIYKKRQLVNRTLRPVSKVIGRAVVITSPTDTVVEGNVKLHYLKKPAVVRYGATYLNVVSNVDCDLPIDIHGEVVTETAMLLASFTNMQEGQSVTQMLSRIVA